MFVPFAALLFNKKREVMLGCSVGHFCSPTNQDGWSKEREERGSQSQSSRKPAILVPKSHLFYHIQNPTIRDDLGIILA